MPRHHAATLPPGAHARPSSVVGRRLVLAAAAILICRLAMALAVIPPWQQPDEPAHVAVAEVWATRMAGAATPDPGREEEIIRSMAEHRWWEHYGQSAPAEPLPSRFGLAQAAVSIGIDPSSPNYPRAYYGLVGAALSRFPRMSVESDLHAMRVFSSLLALLTLLVAWLGAREALGAPAGGVIALLVALHPQFAVVATSAGPDAWVNLAGACLWWQGMLALHRRHWMLFLLGAWAAAAVGAAADRMGVPLLVAAFAVSVVVMLRRARIRPLTVALTLIGGALMAAALWMIDTWWSVFPASRIGYQLTLVPRAMRMEFFVVFGSFLVQSWWFSLGWVRYGPPAWWAAVVFTLSAIAIAGAIRRVFGERDARLRVVIVTAMIMLSTQIAAVYWTYYRIAHGPQGRHLFPFFVPALVLLWIGIEAWTPERYHRQAAVGLVLVFALLDSTAWMVVALPAYAR